MVLRRFDSFGSSSSNQNPMKYTIKQQRTYTTYLTIEANNEAEAEKKYLELLDEGVAYEQELEQMNVDGEDYTILPQ
jgi:hypothetical protein